ncbi:MAG TPA: hypothetical protein VK276_01585 [Rubrobacteraceae bacterium]|nr:hypothetical protein [Rubrobacteraceae bacterium]
MDAERSALTDYDQRFDERLFGDQLLSLRERSQARAKGQLDLKYTVFVLRLVWVTVMVPFLTGAACAFLLGR